jgi:uroporphyrinogen-III synthase
MSESTAMPLEGKRILVTRTREQASVLSERLRALGAIPVEFPTIRIVPPKDWNTLDSALHRLFSSEGSAYDWLVLTSANGVNICCERLHTLGYEARDLQAKQLVRVATIGPATAAALARYGIITDLVPDEYIAESVVAALIADARKREASIAGQRILLARASEARKVLVSELQQAGALVDEVAAYNTLPVAHDDSRGHEILRLLLDRQLAILTFTSSSTVRSFVTWLKSCEQGTTTALIDLVMQHTQLASIGSITSQTARELGLHVDIEAKEFTINGLVNAIVQQHEEKISW